MYGVSRLCLTFRRLRKNFYVHLLASVLFLCCASVILFSAYQGQRKPLFVEVEHQRTKSAPSKREEEEEPSELASPRIQPPVINVNGAVDDLEMAAPGDTLAERIVDRVLTAYDRQPTERPVNMVKAMSDRRCSEYARAAAMTRLVVPDILEHAQYVKEDGEFVTLIAHMTEDRLARLDSILQHWNGPVSIALYVNISHVKDFISRLLEIDSLKGRDNVLLHLIPEEGAIYPVNYLRNVAINNTKTRYIFLSDIDFIPVIGSHNILLDDLQNLQSQKTVFIVPAFEENTSDKYDFPQSKADLIPLWEKKLITPFHLDKFPPGHHKTDFARWKHAKHPYKIEWEPLFEPYVAGLREVLPKYSQRFVGRGMNKIQQIVEIVAMGFEMFVEPEIFLIHNKHSKSRAIATEDKYFICSKKAMTEFNKYIRNKYGFSG